MKRSKRENFIITTKSDYQKLWYKILSQMYKSNIEIWIRIDIEQRTHVRTLYTKDFGDCGVDLCEE